MRVFGTRPKYLISFNLCCQSNKNNYVYLTGDLSKNAHIILSKCMHHNDIIKGLDAGKCTVLSSLDLYAAFDTVDHTICIRRLNYLYGVDGTVLQWFESFLSNRDNKVCVNDVFQYHEMPTVVYHRALF